MDSKNVMHVKLEFDEAKEGKKDVLSMELNILHMLNTIKEYHGLRLEELKNKKKLRKKLRKISASITKMKHVIPKVNMPKKNISEETPIKTSKKSSTDLKGKSEIEIQLQDIQDRLDSIK